MIIPRLPSPAINLNPGDLAVYRYWNPDSADWSTDGVPHLIVSVSHGMAEVLMFERVVRVPRTLLAKFGESCSLVNKTL